MMRECHRVLEPGGRMAGYVIHTPVVLSEGDMAKADELGPSNSSATKSPADLARSAALSEIQQEDVTAHFRVTCEAILRARIELEETLRVEEGWEVFEEEQQKTRNMLLGIDQGLLLRSLIVAEKA